MPTSLPQRHESPPARRDPGIRDIMIAGALLLMVAGLLCDKLFPPTPGYSLAPSASEIQLSP